jgi:hypothetical protein
MYYREKLNLEKKGSADATKQKTNLGARITTNNNISNSISNIQKKTITNNSSSSSSSSSSNINTKSNINKSKTINFDAMKVGAMTNPAMKKRPNPTTGSSAPVEKKAKTEE